MDTEKKEIREREISLIDLFAEILLHWRGILISALLGAVLLGGFGYVRSLQSAKVKNKMLEEQRYAVEQQKEMTEEELENIWETNRVLIENRLSEVQLADIRTALRYKDCYEDKLYYYENSLLMHFDPFHIQQVDMTFMVRTEDDCAYMAKDVYRDLLKNASFYMYVQDQCNIESGVDELIELISNNQQPLQESKASVFSLRIIHDDADTSRAIADAVVDYIQQQNKKLNSLIGNHEVILVNRSQGEIVSNDVVNKQKACVNDLYSMQNFCNTLIGGFTEEQLTYYDYLCEKESGITVDNEQSVQQETESEEPVLAKLNVKYVVLGLFCFAFFYVFIIFMAYIFNNKIRTTDSFQEMYAVVHLGRIAAPERKRFLGAIDRWILKLRYHGRRRFSPEEAVGLTTMAVKMEAKKHNVKNVYLIGCNLVGAAEQVCTQIKSALAKEQIDVCVLNNVLYDAEAMGRLESAEAAVLVETAGVTMYDEITQELQLLNRQKIEVLGGIVVE